MRSSQFLRRSIACAFPALIFVTAALRAEDEINDAPDPAAQEAEVEAIAQLPDNLGLGLRALVQEESSTPATASPAASRPSERPQRDSRRRVLVNIYLDGSLSLADARGKIEAAGGSVTTAIPWYRQGVLSAWVPVKEAASLARQRGLRSIRLAPRPRPHVGKVTSQGATVHKTDVVNNEGYNGAGVTVGVISDSYDADTYDRSDPGFTRAAQDVASGDLPGSSNPKGHLTPVQVVREAAPSSYNSDEGRGMLQIVHDLAPGAKLAFSTSGDTQADFAQNILDLHTNANCKVMVDDIGFFDEPIFSDGMIAQAVNQVAAAGVHYFSAAGNDGNSGYAATYTPTAAATAQPRLKAAGINLASIPPSVRNAIQDWHAFGTDAKSRPIVVQNIRTAARTSLVFQWDDPFDTTITGGNSGVTTDYDILVFNQAGQFLAKPSGTDVNTNATSGGTNEPIEYPYGDLKGKTNYKICIVRTKRTNGVEPQNATHLRYVANANEAITGDYITASNPSIYGHAAASGAAGIAAYDYDISPAAPDATGPHTYSPAPEDFSSNGPVTIYFDAAGQRLSTPEDRQQPIFAGVDNVDTTFFPPSPAKVNPADADSDGFPNFSGTSAAAPHAAAIAALVLDAAAANSISAPTPAAMRNLLKNNTQGLIDQDPGYCAGTAGPVTISALGEDPNSANFFTITFNGEPTQQLTAVTIDLSPTTIHFDPSKKLGQPFVVGKRTGTPKAVVADKPIFSGGESGHASISINFKRFPGGDTLNFGVDRDNNDSNMYGNGADLLGGATISVTVDGTVYTGTFQNVLSKAYNYKVGFGLLDAHAAINALLQ